MHKFVSRARSSRSSNRTVYDASATAQIQNFSNRSHRYLKRMAAKFFLTGFNTLVARSYKFLVNQQWRKQIDLKCKVIIDRRRADLNLCDQILSFYSRKHYQID